MQKQKYFTAGKLPPEFLSGLLRKYASAGKSLITGPGAGEDAAVIDFGGKFLIAKTDPVTFAGENIGHYAVNINANDIAAAGGEPRWFLACLLLPEKKYNRQGVKNIFAEVSSACRRLGISLCGGHTEITPSVKQPVIAGCMLGEAGRDRLTPSSAAARGDDILLTKAIAVEGVSVIAASGKTELKKEFSRKDIAAMKNFVFSPGISVVEEALLANTLPGLNAVHDPTEGGLSTGIYEVASASGTGAEIYREQIPVLDECERICKIFGINPLGLIASGSLLLYCNPSSSDDIIGILKKNKIPCRRIGRVTSGRKVVLADGGKKTAMPKFERDEITRIL